MSDDDKTCLAQHNISVFGFVSRDLLKRGELLLTALLYIVTYLEGLHGSNPRLPARGAPFG
jgi:hypothetical protein